MKRVKISNIEPVLVLGGGLQDLQCRALLGHRKQASCWVRVQVMLSALDSSLRRCVPLALRNLNMAPCGVRRAWRV